MYMDNQIITLLVTSVSGLVVALLAWLTSAIKAKTTDNRLSQIEKSDLKGLYVTCPKCGEKVDLSAANIYKEVSK